MRPLTFYASNFVPNNNMVPGFPWNHRPLGMWKFKFWPLHGMLYDVDNGP